MKRKIIKIIGETIYLIRISILKIFVPEIHKYRTERRMIDFVEKHFNSRLTGVEIGVLFGKNAERMLKKLKIKKLFLVDPYVPYGNNPYIDNNIEEARIKAKKRLSKFKEVVFIEKKPSEAVNDVPDNLDFVYIDGNHDYEFVKKDIELYYPKVKKNGVIGGHDFITNYLGVCRAVVEFATKKNLQLCGSGLDWWVVKR